MHLYILEWCPENINFLGNRAACLMMIGDYYGALNDARRTVLLDPLFVKVCNSSYYVCIYYSDLINKMILFNFRASTELPSVALPWGT